MDRVATRAEARHITRQAGRVDYQKVYLAYTLTLNSSAEENLSSTLASSRVDMNPHQVEAALFAQRSPLSYGVLLADEVGLGKTIEAGLLIAQRWAEQKRKIIVIVPAKLRNQWARELLEKFNLPSRIMEGSSFVAARKSGIINPFDMGDSDIIICSYEFAASRSMAISCVAWDLVVFDEAHKLRNVWKKSGAKRAKLLRDALVGRKKLLLSATPLQNSLIELHGLISIIDPRFFGSIQSFRLQYTGPNAPPGRLKTLRRRLSTICIRTLRRQVQQEGGIKFTRRHSMVEEFQPFPDEMELYFLVSSFLQRDDIISIGRGFRVLFTLVVRKILASSSFAICGTLKKMILRLENELIPELECVDDYEGSYEYEEEYENEKEDFEPDEERIDPAKVREEIEELEYYLSIAQGIKQNAKGNALLTVLERAFARVEELGGSRKAVIFTESRRTQLYLKELLEENGYAGQLVLLNGSNSDPESRRIHSEWKARQANSARSSGMKTSDMTAAIVDAFKNDATILISTESGGEGVNLQFCSLLVNYDLPWNPQRVEQRIGRIHRYGQKYDVVIVNFLNKENEADMRVFELLNKKLKLFEGVFGASDEILGALESEISFEQRINEIYQKCRRPEQIDEEFKKLQKALDGLIASKERDTRRSLLENFDKDVSRRLRGRRERVGPLLSSHQQRLRSFCRLVFPDADHSDRGFVYRGENYYYDWRKAEDSGGHFVTANSPVILHHIEAYRRELLEVKDVTLNTSEIRGRLYGLESFVGRSGWLKVSKVTMEAYMVVERLIFSAMTEDFEVLNRYSCEKLVQIPWGEQRELTREAPEEIIVLENEGVKAAVADFGRENEMYYDDMYERLEGWAEDVKEGMHLGIKRLGEKIENKKRVARKLPSMEEKADARKAIDKLIKKRDKMRTEFSSTCDRVNKEVEELLKEMELKIHPTHKLERVFMIRWTLI